MRIPKEVGDRVQLSAMHCRNTGQFTGPEPPTAYGPHAKGRVTSFEQLGPESRLAHVRWDDGTTRPVLLSNLETCR
jgi:hypothetical protein